MPKVFIVVAVSVLSGLGFGHAASGQETVTSEPAITVVQTQPGVFVYLEHTGPYWTVRAKLRAVVSYMEEHRLSGPIYVRYPSDPTGRHASGVSSEIGFVIAGSHEPEPPFVREVRGAEWVASLPVPSPQLIVPRHYRELHVWVTEHRHRALGPVMEWYPYGFGTSQDGRSRDPASVRMPIEPPAAEALPTPVTAAGETEQPGGIRVIPESAPRALAEEIGLSIDDAATAQFPPNVERPVTDGPVTDGPAITSVTPTHRSDVTMRELLAAGDVDAMAGRLLPPDTPIRADLDLWLGQLVFRISAAGKGLARTYPDESTHVNELSEAINGRYRVASAVAPERTLAQVVVRVPGAGADGPGARQAILRDLDRLLGRIAVRAISAPEASGALADILERAQDVLEADRREPSDRGN